MWCAPNGSRRWRLACCSQRLCAVWSCIVLPRPTDAKIAVRCRWHSVRGQRMTSLGLLTLVARGEVVVKEYAITNQGKVSWLVTKMHSMCTKARLATQIHQIQGKTDGSKKLGFLVDLLHTSIARSILASPSRRWIFSGLALASTGTFELAPRHLRSFRWARRLAAK